MGHRLPCKGGAGDGRSRWPWPGIGEGEGHESCANTVVFGGRCYKAHAANYAMWGRMSARLCVDAFPFKLRNKLDVALLAVWVHSSCSDPLQEVRRGQAFAVYGFFRTAIRPACDVDCDPADALPVRFDVYTSGRTCGWRPEWPQTGEHHRDGTDEKRPQMRTMRIKATKLCWRMAATLAAAVCVFVISVDSRMC